MGRSKIPIEPLKHKANRKITYTKRKNGIVKKVRELSILCDVDAFLLMFSPSGKPSLFVSETSTLEKVIERFSNLTHQERSKRKLESLEALKKTFKKSNHNVNIDDFFKQSPQNTEGLQEEKERIKSQVSIYKDRIASYFGVDMSQISTLDQANNAEKTIEQALHRLRTYKMMQNNPTIGGISTSDQNHVYLPTSSECASNSQYLSSMLNESTQSMENISGLPQGYMNYPMDASILASPGFMPHNNADTVENVSNQQEFNRLDYHGPYQHTNSDMNFQGSVMEFKQETDTILPGNALHYRNQRVDDGFGYGGLPQQNNPTSGYENYHLNNPYILSDNFHGLDSTRQVTNMAIQG
uniref:MADS-box protein 34 n=1 Tax=Cunninghamia lanceolata TaxID=28977 RepID=A0A8F3BZ37_CUNLA|nr:MADS-box protein 34 [Cunninghamia lanceolata]